MPVYTSRTVLDIARGLRAFLNVDAGLVRGAAPNLEQSPEQLEQARSRVEQLRKRLSDKDRQLEQMQERLSEKDQRVAALQARQRFGESDIDSPTYDDDGSLAGDLDAGEAVPLPFTDNEALFGPPTYNYDGLAVWAKDVSFLHEPAFVRAYQIGVNSGHKFSRGGYTLHYAWHVHVACWAAWHAKQLPGSFVECGVNTGNLSLAVCNYIDFNSTGKDFYLFDTFEGIPEEQMAEQERDERITFNREFYEECYDIARRNFAPFSKAKLIRGKVPDTLGSVDIDEVCYLSIDMNIAEPEIAAIEFFWDKLVSGAPVLLDDYGWLNCALQKEEMDKFASKKGVKVLTMPTGQGLLFKP